jgi:hypothetical protein
VELGNHIDIFLKTKENKGNAVLRLQVTGLYGCILTSCQQTKEYGRYQRFP